MSEIPATAAARVAGAAARAGVPLSADDAGRLAVLVERVEAGLEPVGGPGSPGHGARPSPPGDAPAVPAAPPAAAEEADGPERSGWVWRVAVPGAAAPGAGRGVAPAGQPLDGWRLAVKDIIAVGGRPLRCGSAATFDAPPEAADAPVVATLRAAGAHLAGTTRLHEFAFGTIGTDRAFGGPAHPIDPRRVPGGSSSGAAVVVAAGEADLSLGTDTGGSVRIPAALCGVVGLKPSYGALSTVGVFPLAPSLDHVGLLVASPGDLVVPAGVLGLLGPAGGGVAGRGPAGGGAPPPPHRLGVPRDALGLCAEEVVGAFAGAMAALRAAGVELVDVDWPGGEEVFAATTALMFAEAAHGHQRRLAARHRLYGADVRNRLLQGLAVDAATYLTARDVQRDLRRRCLAVLSTVDAVVGPTVPVLAPTLEEAADPAVAARLVTFTRLADITGLPAVSVPLPRVVPGPASSGGRPVGPPLPVGLQIEGATDGDVIGVARSVGEVVAG